MDGWMDGWMDGGIVVGLSIIRHSFMVTLNLIKPWTRKSGGGGDDGGELSPSLLAI